MLASYPEDQSLYLTYDGLTDPLGQSQILPYLKGINKAGYRITIVSFEKHDRMKMYGGMIRQDIVNTNIRWIPLPYHKSPPVLSTVYDLRRLRRKIRSLMRTSVFSVVHCRSYLTAMVALSLKSKYQFKMIFDMRGFWPDERIEGGLWKLSSPLYRLIYAFFKRQEKNLLHNADHIVVLTKAAADVLKTWNVVKPVSIIPCCVDLDLFNPDTISESEKLAVRIKLGFTEKDKVMIYLGSLGTWYLHKEMMDFFRSMKQSEPDLKFLILTPDLDQVKPEEGVVATRVSREEVPRFISIADFCICFIKPSFSKTGSSATKLAEVMAMEISEVMPGMTLLNPGNVVDMIPPKARQQPLFYELFSLQNGIQKYTDIYRALTSDKLSGRSK
jgi:glycosyltransferase involved in cell wall biosynthesis